MESLDHKTLLKPFRHKYRKIQNLETIQKLKKKKLSCIQPEITKVMKGLTPNEKIYILKSCMQEYFRHKKEKENAQTSP